MKKVLIIFLFLTNISFSQTTFVVKDSETLEVIPKVTIDFLNGNGIHSGENGKAVIPKEITEIEISHLGYISQRLKVSEIKEVVLLESNDFEIEEVVINGKRKKTKKIFPKKGIYEIVPANYGNSAPIGFNEMKGVFIPNEEKTECLIIKIYLEPKDYATFDLETNKTDVKKGSKYAPFKVNLYRVNPEIGIPTEKMFENDFEVSLREGEKFVVVELEQRIEFPKEGIFVVISSYDKEYYQNSGFETAPSFRDIGTSKKSKFKQFEKGRFWKRDDRAWEYNSVYYFGLEVEILND